MYFYEFILNQNEKTVQTFHNPAEAFQITFALFFLGKSKHIYKKLHLNCSVLYLKYFF